MPASLRSAMPPRWWSLGPSLTRSTRSGRCSTDSPSVPRANNAAGVGVRVASTPATRRHLPRPARLAVVGRAAVHARECRRRPLGTVRPTARSSARQNRDANGQYPSEHRCYKCGSLQHQMDGCLARDEVVDNFVRRAVPAPCLAGSGHGSPPGGGGLPLTGTGVRGLAAPGQTAQPPAAAPGSTPPPPNSTPSPTSGVSSPPAQVDAHPDARCRFLSTAPCAVAAPCAMSGRYPRHVLSRT